MELRKSVKRPQYFDEEEEYAPYVPQRKRSPRKEKPLSKEQERKQAIQAHSKPYNPGLRPAVFPTLHLGENVDQTCRTDRRHRSRQAVPETLQGAIADRVVEVDKQVRSNKTELILASKQELLEIEDRVRVLHARSRSPKSAFQNFSKVGLQPRTLNGALRAEVPGMQRSPSIGSTQSHTSSERAADRTGQPSRSEVRHKKMPDMTERESRAHLSNQTVPQLGNNKALPSSNKSLQMSAGTFQERFDELGGSGHRVEERVLLDDREVLEIFGEKGLMLRKAPPASMKRGPMALKLPQVDPVARPSTITTAGEQKQAPWQDQGKEVADKEMVIPTGTENASKRRRKASENGTLKERSSFFNPNQAWDANDKVRSLNQNDEGTGEVQHSGSMLSTFTPSQGNRLVLANQQLQREQEESLNERRFAKDNPHIDMHEDGADHRVAPINHPTPPPTPFPSAQMVREAYQRASDQIDAALAVSASRGSTPAPAQQGGRKRKAMKMRGGEAAGEDEETHQGLSFRKIAKKSGGDVALARAATVPSPLSEEDELSLTPMKTPKKTLVPKKRGRPKKDQQSSNSNIVCAVMVSSAAPGRGS